VCNHPNLIAGDVESAFFMKSTRISYAKELFAQIVNPIIGSKGRDVLDIFEPLNTSGWTGKYRSKFGAFVVQDLSCDPGYSSAWSFLPFVGLSCQDLYDIFTHGIIPRFANYSL